MDDKQIVDLYWERSEYAIAETDKKYGKYCYRIAYNILLNEEDAKECVNDTYFHAWQAIPPHRPEGLAAFLGKIVRNLSLNRYNYNRAKKRCNGQIALALEELETCIPTSKSMEQVIENEELTEAINCFLENLTKENRVIFIRRYWYLSSIQEIARDYSLTESKVKMSLLRSRKKLKKFLEREGVAL